MKQPKNVSPIEKYWLIQQFETINRKLDLILLRMQPNLNITPELEAQINLASKLARFIDDKVPGINVPPSS